MHFAIVLGLLLTFQGLCFGKVKEAFRVVDSVLAKYREAPAVTAKVKKTVSSEWMGSQDPSQGDFYFSKGKLRLDFTQPEKSTLVYDGKYVWLESRLDEKTVNVTKLRANDLKRSKSVLTALFEKKNVLNGFKFLRKTSEGGAATYAFEPKDKIKESELLQLSVTLKARDLSRISYKDTLENEVSFDFTDLTPGEVPAAKFQYTPPKNADVTEI